VQFTHRNTVLYRLQRADELLPDALEGHVLEVGRSRDRPLVRRASAHRQLEVLARDLSLTLLDQDARAADQGQPTIARPKIWRAITHFWISFVPS